MFYGGAKQKIKNLNKDIAKCKANDMQLDKLRKQLEQQKNKCKFDIQQSKCPYETQELIDKYNNIRALLSKFNQYKMLINKYQNATKKEIAMYKEKIKALSMSSIPPPPSLDTSFVKDNSSTSSLFTQDKSLLESIRKGKKLKTIKDKVPLKKSTKDNSLTGTLSRALLQRRSSIEYEEEEEEEDEEEWLGGSLFSTSMLLRR